MTRSWCQTTLCYVQMMLITHVKAIEKREIVVEDAADNYAGTWLVCIETDVYHTR